MGNPRGDRKEKKDIRVVDNKQRTDTDKREIQADDQTQVGQAILKEGKH